MFFFRCFCLWTLVSAYCSGECCFLPSHSLACEIFFLSKNTLLYILLAADCKRIWVSTFSTTGKKQTGTLRISENITSTNDEVINYVIGPSGKNCPGPPYHLIRLWEHVHFFHEKWNILWRYLKMSSLLHSYFT